MAGDLRSALIDRCEAIRILRRMLGEESGQDVADEVDEPVADAQESL